MAPSCHVTLWFQTSDSCQQTAASFLWCLLKTQLQMFWPVLSHYGVKSVKSVGSALISGRLPFGSAISSICAANSSHGPWRLCEASRQWSRKDCIVVWGPKQLLVSDQQTSLAQLAEGRKRDKLPTTLCHLWWLCQSAEASLSWARLKTWRGEAFKQGSQEKESLRAWRQAAETILLFRTEAFRETKTKVFVTDRAQVPLWCHFGSRRGTWNNEFCFPCVLCFPRGTPCFPHRAWQCAGRCWARSRPTTTCLLLYGPPLPRWQGILERIWNF